MMPLMMLSSFQLMDSHTFWEMTFFTLSYMMNNSQADYIVVVKENDLGMFS